MPAVSKLLKEKNIQTTLDEDAKQNFATYTEAGKVYKIWIEDEFSMRQRIALVKEYDLPGVASWRKGFEEQTIWGVIENELTKMP